MKLTKQRADTVFKYSFHGLCLLLALLVSFGFGREFTYWSVYNGYSQNSVLYVLVFIGAFLILRKGLLVRGRGVMVASAVLGVLFSAMLIVGRSLEWDHRVTTLFFDTNGGYQKTRMVHMLGQFLGCGLLFYALLALMFRYLLDKGLAHRLSYDGFWSFKNRRHFFVIWFVIWLCWVPYYLMLFPGVISPDTLGQLRQIVYLENWSNHHPLIHTLLMFPFVKLGQVCGSVQAGVASYVMFQMMYMSATFAFAVYYLGRRRFHRLAPIVACLYFALFPVNGYYSVTPWKDQPFGCALLLFTIALAEILRRREAFFTTPGNWAWFLSGAAGVMLLRNNGLYVILLTFPLLLIFLKGVRLQLLVGVVVCGVVFGLYKGPLFSALDVKEGRAGEALSVPLQQLARVQREHRDELSEEDVAFYREMFPDNPNIGDAYQPGISDPVKWQFNDAWYAENKGAFFGKWVELGTRYPTDYVESYLCGSFGYWNPEVQYWTVLSYLLDNEMGITRQSAFPGAVEYTDRIGLGNMRQVPGVSMLYSIGFHFWLLLLAGALLLLKRQPKWLLLLAPVLLLWLTCTASPVYAEFRYIYGMFTCLPVLLPLALWAPRRGKAEETEEAAPAVEAAVSEEA